MLTLFSNWRIFQMGASLASVERRILFLFQVEKKIIERALPCLSVLSSLLLRVVNRAQTGAMLFRPRPECPQTKSPFNNVSLTDGF
jgi:hypothetical protein